MASDKFGEEGEPRLLFKVGEVLVIFDQDLVLLLRPLVLINNTFILFLRISINIIISSENCLFVSKDDILIVGAIDQLVVLILVIFVDHAVALNSNRVVAKDLVFDLLCLEAEHSFHRKHRVVNLQLDKLSNDNSDDLFELVEADLQLALIVRLAACSSILHNALHKTIRTSVLLQELVKVVHVVHLIEDPSLLELEMNSAEEAGCHLNQVSLFAESIFQIYDSHVAADNLIVDQKGDLSVEVQLSLYVLLLV